MKRVVLSVGSAALLASMAVTGNVNAASHATAKTKTVTICTSTPVGVPSLQQLSQGIQNGVNIAIHVFAPKLKAAGLKVVQKNYDYSSTTDNSNYDATRAGTNAHACIGIHNSVGLVGTLNSAAALVAEPITNKAHLVMVSPANTNPTLTDPADRSANEPDTANHSIKTVTYFRTVTTDKLQGPAGAEYANASTGKHGLNAKNYFLVTDGLTYGVGLATYFKQEAGKLGMSEVGNQATIDTTNTATSSSTIAGEIENDNPDVVYCGCDSETSNLLAYDLRSGVPNGSYTKPFVAGDAIIDNPDWLNSTTNANPGAGVGAENTGGTTVGPANAAAFFAKDYKKYDKTFYNKYGIQPYDATSYDAAGALLTAIIGAEKAGKLKGSITAQRTAVVAKMAAVKFTGATGKTTFDKDGDTTNKILSIYHVVGSGSNLSWKFLYQFSASGSPV